MREGMYERKGWVYELVIAFTSPLLLLAVLLVLELVFRPANSPLYLSLIWSVIALGAVLISSILFFYALKTWLGERVHYSWHHPRGLLPLANMVAAAGFLTVHVLFLSVGVNSIGITPPPETQEYLYRTILSRTLLLEGQYILLVTGIVTYIMHRKIRHDIGLEIDGESERGHDLAGPE